MRLLIAGSRDWQDETPIRQALERARPTVLIHGAARGADSIAARLAHAMGIEVLPFSRTGTATVVPQDHSVTSACWTRGDRTGRSCSRITSPLRTERGTCSGGQSGAPT